MDETVDIEETGGKVCPGGRTRSADTIAGHPLTMKMVTLMSMLNVPVLLSLFAGICYFYDRAYREAYFRSFGLNPNAVPVTVQDAIADGFIGININVLWLVLILMIATVAYVIVAWFGARLIDSAVEKLGTRQMPRSPPAAIFELKRNGGFQLSVGASLLAFGATLASMTALFLIGIPGDRAGRRDADRLRDSMTKDQIACLRHDLKGGASIIGKSLGGTAERAFILGVEGTVKVLRFDDVTAIVQVPVSCGKPDRGDGESHPANIGVSKR